MNTEELLTERVKERGVAKIILDYKYSIEHYEKFQRSLFVINNFMYHTIQFDELYQINKSVITHFFDGKIKVCTYNYNSFLSLLNHPSTRKRYLKITSRIILDGDEIYKTYYIHEDFMVYPELGASHNRLIVFVSGHQID